TGHVLRERVVFDEHGLRLLAHVEKHCRVVTIRSPPGRNWTRREKGIEIRRGHHVPHEHVPTTLVRSRPHKSCPYPTFVPTGPAPRQHQSTWINPAVAHLSKSTLANDLDGPKVIQTKLGPPQPQERRFFFSRGLAVASVSDHPTL
ncbi:7713_t:CDS:2, partial [Acaulospora colombiana]